MTYAYLSNPEALSSDHNEDRRQQERKDVVVIHQTPGLEPNRADNVLDVDHLGCDCDKVERCL